MVVKSRGGKGSKGESNRVSFAPSAFEEGTGLPDDFDGTIKEVRFVEWDYDGKTDEPVLALAVEIEPDGDSDVPLKEGEETFVQYFSAGKLKNFVPSDDGKSVERVGKSKGLNNKTNFYQFIESAVNAGFAEEMLEEEDISCLEGMRAHFVRVAQPKRKWLDEEGKDRGTVLTISEIHEMPGESVGGKAKSKGKVSRPSASAKPAKPAKPVTRKKQEEEEEPEEVEEDEGEGEEAEDEDTDEVDDADGALAKAAAILTRLLKKEKTLKRKDIVTKAFSMVDKADRKEVLGIIADKEFLGDEDQPWSYDEKKDTVSAE